MYGVSSLAWNTIDRYSGRRESARNRSHHVMGPEILDSFLRSKHHSTSTSADGSRDARVYVHGYAAQPRVKGRYNLAPCLRRLPTAQMPRKGMKRAQSRFMSWQSRHGDESIIGVPKVLSARDSGDYLSGSLQSMELPYQHDDACTANRERIETPIDHTAALTPWTFDELRKNYCSIAVANEPADCVGLRSTLVNPELERRRTGFNSRWLRPRR
ncbi:hypothetical protein ACRALDRAFT_211362 [Sodiomyces alcalophilus JCM 7366]|uniref:uncharacterized protein n=1 Tax=Sodiomyces alcalophilus JCM 7366 TaxID=591952 RepID=UPI0039B65695